MYFFPQEYISFHLSQPSEAGVHLRFPCCRGKTYSGFAEDLPFPGGEVQNGWGPAAATGREEANAAIRAAFGK